MASQADHIALANRNHEALLHLLAEGRFLDWAATIAFYKAVHIVEAVLDSNLGHHSNSHTERERSLKTVRFKDIYRPYSHLFAASRVARYLLAPTGSAYSTFSDYMDRAGVRKLVTKQLFGVEQSALDFLSNASRSALTKIQPEAIP